MCWEGQYKEVHVRAVGRSLSDFEPLFKLERALLTACRKGVVAQGQIECPEEASDDNKVRAEFIRFLLLGADDDIEIHENGVRLSKAYVTGILDLRYATVDYIFSLGASRLERITVFSNVQFKQAVSLAGSRLKGLKARGMSVRGDFKATKIQSSHPVDLNGISVRGGVDFSGAVLQSSSTHSLTAIDAKIQGGLFFADGFTAEGLVRVVGAEVGGQFNCRGGAFLNDEKSLDAGNIKVGRGVFLIGGFKSCAEVSFIAATVKAQFCVQNATLSCKKGVTLTADRIRVNGNLYMDKGFVSEGCVSLNGGEILGQLNCAGARFVGKQPFSLAGNNLHVTGAANLGGGFSCEGIVSFHAAKFESDLSFSGAESIAELRANRACIKGALIISKVKKTVHKVSLAGAYATALNDDANSWGKQLVLNGFVYDFLDVHNTMSVSERVKWLEKQWVKSPRPNTENLSVPTAFVPQPWLQLKNVLESMGRAEESREIGIEYERHRAKCGQIGLSPATWNPVRRGLNWVVANALHISYGKLIGYGYRPMQLVSWFLGVWLLTTVLYWYAANQGAVFAPSDPLIFQNQAYMTCQPSSDKTFEPAPGTGNWYLCNALPQEYTGFSPVAFSLDLLLPLVDLHQEKDWAPLIETPKANVGEEIVGIFSLKRFVRFVMWLEILAGWVFSLLFVVIVSGLARRKEQ